MKLPLKVGLIASLLFVVIKLICFKFEWLLYDINPFVFINLFIITAAITISLYQIKRYEEDGNFLNDIKNGMTAGVPYALIVSIFLFIYYNSINPDFTQSKIDYMEHQLNDPDNIKSLRNTNEDLSNKSDEEIKRVMMDRTKDMYSPNFTMVITLLGLTIYSALNSIMISIILRKIVFRN